MSRSIILACLFLTACAHSSSSLPTPANAPPPKSQNQNQNQANSPIVQETTVTPPATSPQNVENETTLEEENSTVESSNLSRAISIWISQNTNAEFEEVARAANRIMRQIGFPLALDVAKVISPKDDEVQIRAGRKVFHFRSGKELAERANYCGERYVRVPARILSQDSAALVSGNKTYTFSLAPYRREVFRVLRGKKLVSTFYAPEPSEPIGVSGNGRAIYLRFNLDEALTADWWMGIARQQPALLDEDPYLALRVGKRRLYFDENIEHLPAQELEVDETTKKQEEVYRWRFLPSGFLLELSTQCGTSK